MATAESEERRALTVFWKIENIAFLKRSSKVISSIKFSPRTLGIELNVNLLMESRSTGSNSNDYICICVAVLDGILGFNIDYESSIIGINGSPLVNETVRNCDIQSDEVDLKLVSYQELFETRRSDFLPHDTLKVRCRIWKSEGEFSHHEFISLRTLYERIDISFLWPVSGFNFLELNQEVTTPIRLECFYESAMFDLKFSLKGESTEDAYPNLELALVSIKEDLSLSLKVSVLDNEQKTFKYAEIKDRYFDQYEEQTVNLPQFLTRAELLRSNCLSNNVLTFYVQLSGKTVFASVSLEKWHYGHSKSEDFSKCALLSLDAASQSEKRSVDPSDTSLIVGHSLSVLGEDLLSLYRDQSMPDFELRSSDVSFPVHKNVLSARSSVFWAMFSSNMEESGSKSLNVPDLDVHTLNRLLTFLYGATVDAMEWESALKLYYAADKYQVQSLKRECCSFFRSNISVRNAVDIVRLADRHHDSDLNSIVHRFILNHFDETVSSPEWVKFLESDSQLAGMTMHNIYMEKIKAKKN